MAKISPTSDTPVWNVFDEKGLQLGLERKSGESNIDLHNRIVDYEPGNSTPAGIASWILNAFDVDEVYPDGINIDIIQKYVFKSLYQPISKVHYQTYKNPEVEFASPKIMDQISGAVYELDITEYMPFGSRDIFRPDPDDGTYWALYKFFDGSYSRIWISSYAAEEVHFEYIGDLDGELYTVLERPELP